MLYTIMLVFLFFYCCFYVKSLVLKALSLSPSLIVYRIFCPQAIFCLHVFLQMEYFLCCRRLAIYIQKSHMLLTPLTS